MSLPTSPALERAFALAVLGLIAAAAGLEAGVVPVYGGTVLVVAMAVAVPYLWIKGVDTLPPVAKVGLAFFALTALYQALPVPHALRSVVAPGQAAWIDRVAPEWGGELGPWLRALVQHDILAAVGVVTPWTFGLLAGSEATLTRIGALAPDPFAWALAQLLAGAVLYLVGVQLGRSPIGTRTLLIGMLVLAVAEAVFGLANRNGPSTGIGIKEHYLGSATGTFINRGHFGAFLSLGIGAAWGLGAGLFPLLPEEVRKHAQRSRRSSQPPSVFEASGDRIPRLSLLAFMAAMVCVAIVASQSRGPVLAIAVAGIGVGLWMWRRRAEGFHLGIALALPITGGLLALLAFGPAGAFGRFRTVLSGDASVASRLDLWRDGLSAWLDAPIFGAGLGGWPLAHGIHERADHLFEFDHAHNEAVELLVETGLVGSAGVLLVLFAAARGLRRALADLPHDEGVAAGVGALVGCLAVLLQSLGDFPLHAPGVLVPFAVFAGLAHGSLVAPAPSSRVFPFLIVASLAALLAGRAAWMDRGFVGTRNARISERGAIWSDPRHGSTRRADVAAWGGRARDLLTKSPLDPWLHAAVAESEARLAQAAWALGGARDPGDAPEDHALRADLAISRALRLRPHEPRLELICGQALALLAEGSGTPDAFRARAVDALTDAVRRDPWRAEEAFAIARALPIEALAQIDAAAGGTPRFRARVHYLYGKALEARGQRADALAAQESAAEADPRYAPALFAAAVLRRSEGDDTAADALLRRFLVAEERPAGMEGWALLTLGEVDEAKVRFQRVVRAAPTNRWAWEGLAEVSKRKKEVENERAALERIVAIDPGQRAARQRLNTLSDTPADR